MPNVSNLPPLTLPAEALAVARVLIAHLRTLEAGKSKLPPSQMLQDAYSHSELPLAPDDATGHMTRLVAQLTVVVCEAERMHIERWILSQSEEHSRAWFQQHQLRQQQEPAA